MEFEGAFIYATTVSGLDSRGCGADDEIALLESIGQSTITHAGVADYISTAARSERSTRYLGLGDVNMKVTQFAKEARNNYAVEL